jgi:hypothetical protein
MCKCGVLRNTCSCKNRGPQGLTGPAGNDGADGNGVVSITFDSTTDPGGLPAQAGATDTYRIDYTDGTFALYNVVNGANGVDGVDGVDGTNGTNGTNGTDGVGISNIAWTSNSGGQPQGTQGTTDTYTITLTDASTYNFLVTNGADGAPGGGFGISSYDVQSYSGLGPVNFTAAVNTAYVLNDVDAVPIQITLPAVCAVGDEVSYVVDAGGLSTNLRVIPNPGASQTVIAGIQETTPVTGYLEYAGVNNSKSYMKLVCIEANTKWMLTEFVSYEAAVPTNLWPLIV